MTLTTPTLGVICHPMANTTCWDEYATKYEVSSLNRSKDIEWSSVDKICTAHAQYRVIHKQ